MTLNCNRFAFFFAKKDAKKPSHISVMLRLEYHAK